MADEGIGRLSNIATRSIGGAVGPKKKEKTHAMAPPTNKLTLGEGLFCVDFLPGYNMLAIGSTKMIHVVEVMPAARFNQATGTTADVHSSSSLCTPPSMVLRSSGSFSTVAKVETLAWYPGCKEAVLAFVQLNQNVTVLFDALVLKENRYITRQWTQNAKKSCLLSSIMAGSEPLSAAVVGANSTLSTPFFPSSAVKGSSTMGSVSRAKVPSSMVEVVINTGHLRVEHIVWDPHNLYTLALTTDATHFELWTIPIIDNSVYAPKLTLRPRAHDERSTTRGIAFSPSDPNLIIVVVEVANVGKVVVYDRRHVEVPRFVETMGPCLTVGFHPTFCDLLAVCYRRAKTKTDSRVQFFRVLSDASVGSQKAALCGSNNFSSVPRNFSPVVEQDVIPPIDSVDSHNRLRWRPRLGMSEATVGRDGGLDVNETSIDLISSQLLFATTALNVQEITVWDAANGFSPAFSIKCMPNERERAQRDRALRDRLKRERADCVWVNPLTLVSVFWDEVVLTCLLDEPTTNAETLFRCAGGTKGDALGDSHVFSLGAILPTASVVADLFGRSFVARNTSSLLREHYARIFNDDKSELQEVLTQAVTENNACGTSSVITSLSASPLARTQRESTRVTPSGESVAHTCHLSLLHMSTAQTPLQMPTQWRGSGSSPATSLLTVNPVAPKRHEHVFPLLLSPSSLLVSIAGDDQRNDGVGNKSVEEFVGKRCVAASNTIAIESRPHRYLPLKVTGMEMQSENSVDEKTWTLLKRRSGETAAVLPISPGTILAPVDSQAFVEGNELAHPAPGQSGNTAILSPISLAQSEDENTRKTFSGATKVGCRFWGTSLLPEVQVKNAAAPSKEGDSSNNSVAALLKVNTMRAPPLGLRSFVNPVIEPFVLSDEVCGWAYVERSLEQESFVRYAMEWEVGYETARKMRAARHATVGPVRDLVAVDTVEVDHRFARMMAHNARVCEAREREVQKQSEKDGSINADSGRGGRENIRKRKGSGVDVAGAVDPRGQFWAAATQAWRSHRPSVITSLVCSQLEYASLVGDVQYCVVLYLLFCLWWRQRYVCVQRYPCPLLPNSKEPPNSSLETRSRKGSDMECSPQKWRLRALQWVEQYVSRLYAKELYVPLNELLLIVPDVIGDSNTGLPRAEDIAQKLFTCVYCGICPKAELVPQFKKKDDMLSCFSASVPPLDVQRSEIVTHAISDGDDADDDDVANIFSASSCSSLFDSSSSSLSFDRTMCGGNKVVKETTEAPAMERGRSGGSSGVVTFCHATDTVPRNAICRRCHRSSLMTCVICEEVVEGIYMWLRSCGHGGHVHHLKEWLQVSNECPRCGVPILCS